MASFLFFMSLITRQEPQFLMGHAYFFYDNAYVFCLAN